MGYWNHDYGSGWFGLMVMLVAMLVFWGGLAAIAVILVRRFGHAGHAGQAHGGSDAERILDERFARGEIDEEALLNRRAALREDRSR